jgi:hypothetical protein
MTIPLFFDTPYHLVLLAAADNLLLQQQPGVAVVTAHMACEIVTEQAIAAAFNRRGLGDLEEVVTAWFQSNNLANDRIRDVYVALTGDRIQDAPFWGRFTASSKLRNHAVHRGKLVSPQEAKDCCTVVREVIAHLEAVAKRP